MEELHYELVDLYNQLEIKMPVPSIINFEEVEKGATALDCCPPKIDVNKYKDVFTSVLKIFRNNYSDAQNTFRSLYDLVMQNDELLEDKINAVFQGKDINIIYDLEKFEDPSLANFVISHSIKPFLLAYAESMEGIFPKEKWKKQYCPICGHDPSFARLAKDENGKRYLICIVCETQWHFNRIKCPYCLEEHPDKLGYFRVEDHEEFDGYRVSYCLSCKRYIKTYDEKGRIKKINNYYLENIKTASLDFLAQKEGFIR